MQNQLLRVLSITVETVARSLLELRHLHIWNMEDGMKVLKQEVKHDQKIKSRQNSRAIDASKMSFALARTIYKLSYNFPCTIAHQKSLPAQEKFSSRRYIHLIHQPRKC
ncbi:death-associated protein-like 1 [Hypanus sabinus]|uniref:death-associated protein-like 1 n=1 Tax=Hypanus sabinus TaxID=79690 RepID=UPI0028C482C5|nr:death-associated protein-like 1 [Hypanus sabinus]